jgi:hypothetical protein
MKRHGTRGLLGALGVGLLLLALSGLPPVVLGVMGVLLVVVSLEPP